MHTTHTCQFQPHCPRAATATDLRHTVHSSRSHAADQRGDPTDHDGTTTNCAREFGDLRDPRTFFLVTVNRLRRTEPRNHSEDPAHDRSKAERPGRQRMRSSCRASLCHGISLWSSYCDATRLLGYRADSESLVHDNLGRRHGCLPLAFPNCACARARVWVLSMSSSSLQRVPGNCDEASSPTLPQTSPCATWHSRRRRSRGAPRGPM